jgi:RimJ/RimL family protein N-acetyltransferase
MPTWMEHLKFIASRPYSAWYLVMCGDEHVGATYLSRLNEIGIGIFSAYQKSGYSKEAVRLLMKKHPRDRYLANINPRNGKSIRMFQQMGFRMIQHTYELT